MNTDITEDLRIGPEILKQQAELYRRLRNTLRWLLGSLDGFSDAERVPDAEMPELERFVLHRLCGTRRPRARRRWRATTGPASIRRSTISAPPISRRSISISARTRSIATGRTACAAAPRARVLDHLHRCLTTWLAPVLVFTAEEAWIARFGEAAQRASAGFSRTCRRAGATTALRGEMGANPRDIRRVDHRSSRAMPADARARSAPRCRRRRCCICRRTRRRCLRAEEWAEIAIVSKVDALDRAGADDAFRIGRVRRRGQPCGRPKMRALLAGAAGGRREPRASGAVPALRGRGRVGLVRKAAAA